MPRRRNKKTGNLTIAKHTMEDRGIPKDAKGVFIHIPKAGGSTAYNHFYKIKIHRYQKHATALYVKNKVGKDIWEDWHKIAWVRNPWQRAFCQWKWSLERQKCHKIKDFKKWLLESRKVCNHLIDCPTAGKRNPLSALTYISDLDGNILVDFVGRMEYMKEDLNRACEELNLDHSFNKVFHKNKHGFGKDYLKNYDYETSEYIERICAWEIETFGYKFEKL